VPSLQFIRVHMATAMESCMSRHMDDGHTGPDQVAVVAALRAQQSGDELLYAQGAEQYPY
jgi:hypothetical protein